MRAKAAATKLCLVALVACLALTAGLASGTGDAAAAEAPFPTASPDSQGIPPAALQKLSEYVAALVDNEEIVGAELAVIKSRKTVYHEVFGWMDREAERPMERNSIFCVRSMTKPLVGTAIQMLIEEGKLALDTPVKSVLPSFDGPETGKITVEHLLTHTGGLPLTTMSRPLTGYADIVEVAAEAAEKGPDFEPGSRFQYSDAGSDTLGAIVSKIAGMPVEQFVQRRILDPLGMKETLTLLGQDEAVRKRVPSAYSGGTGSWTKHWEPSDPPIFPLFLTSQSLYSTIMDYARFLALWMDDGRAGDRRLISTEAVTRALEPANEIGFYPSGFDRLQAYYGQQWMVYAEPVEGAPGKWVVFGHGGSDGTHAWVWPELDLMVLFFTQSRGALAGLGLEGVLQTLLVDQKIDEVIATPRGIAPQVLERIVGLYWDEDVEEAYYAVLPQGGYLVIERPGRFRAVMKPSENPWRFVGEISDDFWLEFHRSEEGAVIAMEYRFGGRIERGPRHAPEEGLPSPEEIIAQVQKAHRIDRLPELAGVRLTGTITLEDRGLEGPFTMQFDGTGLRTVLNLGGAEQMAVSDGVRVWSSSPQTGRVELEGVYREQSLLEHPASHMGDWREDYEEVEVLRRVRRDDRDVILIRTVPGEAPGSTKFVDAETGLVIREERLVQFPGLGFVGVRTDYEDFRDVGGMQLPFRSAARFATPLIGRIEVRVEKAETGVELPAGIFTLPE